MLNSWRYPQFRRMLDAEIDDVVLLTCVAGLMIMVRHRFRAYPIEAEVSFLRLFLRNIKEFQLTYNSSFVIPSNSIPSASFQILFLTTTFFAHFLCSSCTFSLSSLDNGLIQPDLSTCRRAAVSAR